MAYRDGSSGEKAGVSDFSIVEVHLKKKGAPAGTKDEVRLMLVDNHSETLGYLQNHLKKCIGNMVRLKRMEPTKQKG